MWNDPEALAWVVNNGDRFSGGRADGPRSTQEVEGVIGIEPTLEVQGQMQIQQGYGWGGTEVGAFFLESQIPGGIGG